MNQISKYTLAVGGILAISGLIWAQTTSTPAPTTAKAPAGSGIAAPADPNKVVLQIGDEKMTASQFQEMIKNFPPNVQQAANGPQRREFIDQYIRLKVTAKEAERRGIQNRPEVKQQLAIQHDNILAQALYQEMVASVKVSDADVAKYYADHKNEFETAKAHHILIRFKGSPVPLGKDKRELTKEEALAAAKAVQKRLLAGEDFEKVAKEVSDDTSPNGDLGNITHGQMVPAFDAAVFSLPVGKVSDPVETQFGYHIIRVDSRESKTLEQAKDEIEKKLRPEEARKEMESLRDKGNVMVDESYFPVTKPTMAPGGPAAK